MRIDATNTLRRILYSQDDIIAICGENHPAVVKQELVRDGGNFELHRHHSADFIAGLRAEYPKLAIGDGPLVMGDVVSRVRKHAAKIMKGRALKVVLDDPAATIIIEELP